METYYGAVSAAQALNRDTLHAAYVGIFRVLQPGGIEVLSHAFIGGMPKLPRSGQRAKLDIDQQVRLEPSRFRLFNLAG
jgi:hypothetical protein